MKYQHLVDSISERFATKIVRASFFPQYNKELLEMARREGIEIPHGTNLVSLAIKAAHDAGAREDAEEIGLDVINQAIFREKSDDEKAYAPRYVRYLVMPSLVHQLKSKGFSVEEIKHDHHVKDLIRRYGVKEQYIEKLFNSDMKPKKPITEMLQKKNVRPTIFKEYNPSHGTDFSSFWYNVLHKQAINMVRDIHTADRLLHDALRIAPKKHEHDHHTIEDIAHKEEHMSKSEAKMNKKHLVDALKKRNPKYEKALKLISDGHDILSMKDKHVFEKALDMSSIEFGKFKNYFVKDMKDSLHHIGIYNPDEGLAVIRSAKIAAKIIEKLI